MHPTFNVRFVMAFLLVLTFGGNLFAESLHDPRLLKRWGGDELYFGNDDSTTALSFSADGRYLARQGHSSGAIVYDLNLRQAIRYWPLSTGITQIEFLAEPDEVLLMISARGQVHAEIWSVARDQKLDEIADLSNQFAISDDRRFLTVAHDRKWIVIELATGKVSRTLDDPLLRPGTPVSKISLSPNGQYLAYLYAHTETLVWDLESGEKLAKYENADPQFLGRGNLLALMRHKSVEVYDVSSGERQPQIPCDGPMRLGFFPDEERIWVVANWQMITANLQTGKLLSEVQNVKGNLYGSLTGFVAASFDGKRLAVADTNEVRIQEVGSFQPLDPQQRTTEWAPGAMTSFLRDGKKIFCSDNRRSWTVRDASGENEGPPRITKGPVRQVAVSPTDDLLVLLIDRHLEWWRLDGQEPFAARELSQIRQFQFSEDGSELFGINYGKELEPFLFNANTREERKVPVRGGDAIAQLADGRWITFRTIDSELRIRSNDRYSCVLTEPGGLRQPLIMPGGKTIVARSKSEVIFWDLASCEEVRRISIPMDRERYSRGLVTSHDGSLLAIVDIEQKIHIWDLVKGQERCLLRGHINPITSLSFSLDCTRLVSGSRDGTSRLWNVEP